jgi:transposase InsO family protein
LGWVEECALLNGANRWVAEAIGDIRTFLLLSLTGGHYDNDMEFTNKPLLEWCLARHIRASRSRPYRKNDNCFAEQKNYDVVRKMVGYFRFDTEAEREVLVGVYKYLCPLYNYWYPSFRLTDKERQGEAVQEDL